VTEQPEQDLTPDQEADVRRLLADARHTEPTPDTVVARLDRVLAGLADEPAREATVVRLADRRRRAATMLVAAAASVAAVIGVGQVLSGSRGGETDSASSGDAGAVPESGADAPEAQSDDSDRVEHNGITDRDRANNVSRKLAPLAVQSDEFAADAETLKSLALQGYAEYEQDETTSSLRRARDRTVCEPGGWGRGSYVAVVYDDAEGWVVLRQPQGETQIADLFLCGSESVVRSVTLPYP